jgi:hypothetical protein
MWNDGRRLDSVHDLHACRKQEGNTLINFDRLAMKRRDAEIERTTYTAAAAADDDDDRRDAALHCP